MLLQSLNKTKTILPYSVQCVSTINTVRKTTDFLLNSTILYEPSSPLWHMKIHLCYLPFPSHCFTLGPRKSFFTSYSHFNLGRSIFCIFWRTFKNCLSYPCLFLLITHPRHLSAADRGILYNSPSSWVAVTLKTTCTNFHKSFRLLCIYHKYILSSHGPSFMSDSCCYCVYHFIISSSQF